MTKDTSSIEALTFHVFGTVVDWRGSIVEEGRRLGKSKNIDVDWAKFADGWRAGCAPPRGLDSKRPSFCDRWSSDPTGNPTSLPTHHSTLSLRI
ncbi:MAG: hypothetical protein ACREQK_13165 [Candidatus Binatia bacterium]